MNLVMFGWFAATEMFLNLTDIDFKNMLYTDRLRAIEDDMVPFGIIDDGHKTSSEVDSQGQVWESFPTDMI
jgi:hypothetical protein